MTVKDLISILETVNPGLTVIHPGTEKNGWNKGPINYVAVWDADGYSSKQKEFTPPGVVLVIEASDFSYEYAGNLVRSQARKVESLEDLL